MQETYELWDTLLYDSGVTGTKKTTGIVIGSGITETITDDYTTLAVTDANANNGMYRYAYELTSDFVLELTIKDRSAYNRLCGVGVRNKNTTEVSMVNLSSTTYDQVFDNKWAVIRFKRVNDVFSAQYRMLDEDTWHDMDIAYNNSSGTVYPTIYVYNKNTGTTDYLDFKDLKVYSA